mmetsp:Transcript_95310/g.307207  ORF Transcript_95310/g.307207 Transcript_95310/m.307207 type:complete len:200 (-) Transcript_95310:1384-1983(-)
MSAHATNAPLETCLNTTVGTRPHAQFCVCTRNICLSGTLHVLWGLHLVEVNSPTKTSHRKRKYFQATPKQKCHTIARHTGTHGRGTSRNACWRSRPLPAQELLHNVHPSFRLSARNHVTCSVHRGDAVACTVRRRESGREAARLPIDRIGDPILCHIVALVPNPLLQALQWADRVISAGVYHDIECAICHQLPVDRHHG